MPPKSGAAPSPKLSRRLSLAPSQAHNTSSAGIDDDGASLLIDLSLSDLQKTSSPEKTKRSQLSDDALDALSEEELERLAWEAIEEENNLKAQRRRNPRFSGEDTIAMKNITVRRKSNSPKKIIEQMLQPEVLAPLPRTFSSSTIKHSYDRQASPSRSAMKKSRPRKSVVFGSIDEYEISIDAANSSDSVSLEELIAIPLTRNAPAEPTVRSSSSSVIGLPFSASGSSSPLSRFNKKIASAPKVMLDKIKVKGISPRKAPNKKAQTNIKMASALNDVPVSKKTSSKASPKAALVGSRMREAIKETSAKSRLKARQSTVLQKAKSPSTATSKAPTGFRLSSTGALIAETQCQPFKAATAKSAPRRGRSSASNPRTQAGTTSKAHPVPAWMQRRRAALAKAEDDRLQAELERVRSQGLNGSEKPAPTLRREAKQVTTIGGPISAMEKRIAERAVWEAKRKEKEELINAEKDRARKEREAREDEEYRLARQKTVVRANPVPDFIRSRRAR